MKSLFARKAARGHWPHEVRRQRMGGVHLRTNLLRGVLWVSA